MDGGKDERTGQLSYKTNNVYVRDGLPRVPPLLLLLLLLIKMPPPTIKTAQLRTCRVPTDLLASNPTNTNTKGGQPMQNSNRLRVQLEFSVQATYERLLGILYAGSIPIGIVYVRTAVVNLQVSIVYVPLWWMSNYPSSNIWRPSATSCRLHSCTASKHYIPVFPRQNGKTYQLFKNKTDTYDFDTSYSGHIFIQYRPKKQREASRNSTGGKKTRLILHIESSTLFRHIIFFWYFHRSIFLFLTFPTYRNFRYDIPRESEQRLTGANEWSSRRIVRLARCRPHEAPLSPLVCPRWQTLR